MHGGQGRKRRQGASLPGWCRPVALILGVSRGSVKPRHAGWIMGLRGRCSRHSRIQARDGSTPGPAPRLSPPRPCGWPPAGLAKSSNPGGLQPRAARPGSLEDSHSLLDHLIRPLQERPRDREAEGLGGFEVDRQFELRRFFHWLSLGLPPRSIRSTNPPARRWISIKSVPYDIRPPASTYERSQ